MNNLKPEEAAKRLDVTKATLATWRYRGYGPRYIKYGAKVLYPETEIDAFLQGCLRDVEKKDKRHG